MYLSAHYSFALIARKVAIAVVLFFLGSAFPHLETKRLPAPPLPTDLLVLLRLGMLFRATGQDPPTAGLWQCDQNQGHFLWGVVRRGVPIDRPIAPMRAQMQCELAAVILPNPE